MIVVLWKAAAAADIPPITDQHDAYYLETSGRAEAAADWFLAHRDDDPADVGNLVGWLRTIGQVPAHRNPAVVELVRRWGADHPQAEGAGVALAMAHSLAELGPQDYGLVFHRAGDWCALASDALATLPDDGLERYRVLRARVRVATTCKGPSTEDERAVTELALSGLAGPMPRARVGLEDGTVDDDDLRAVEASLAEGWWNLRPVAPYAADGYAGPAAEAARDRVLEEARRLVATDRPAQIAAGMTVLHVAKLPDEVNAAAVRLRDLDPGNANAVWQVEHPATADDVDVEEEEEAPKSATILDPAVRHAALRDEGPPEDDARWDRTVYWSARADAASAVGDAADQLFSLHQLRRAGMSGVEVRFAELAVDRGQQLRRAWRASSAGIDRLRDPDTYAIDATGSSWGEELARALTARAAVAEALGWDVRAVDDLEEALLVGGPDPDRLVRLGLRYAAWDWETQAAPLLGAGLVELPGDDPRQAEARTELERMLGTLGGWRPDVDTYVAAFRARAATRTAPAALDGSRFADVVVVIDGREQRLLDIEGPLVVDVWATWCGPCMQSLPHLDALARKHAEEATFVALSVDDEIATAERYLARRGEPAFVSAWLAGGMSAIGVDGIPAMFVFDADHRLIRRLDGWGPGSTALDEAVATAITGR